MAPPVITYLMAMNHEPVVNSGEVRGKERVTTAAWHSQAVHATQ